MAEGFEFAAPSGYLTAPAVGFIDGSQRVALVTAGSPLPVRQIEAALVPAPAPAPLAGRRRWP